MSFTSGPGPIKRARTEDYTPGPTPGPAALTTSRSRAMNVTVVMETIFGFFSLKELAHATRTCKRFQVVAERPEMQRLFCNLLGIRPLPTLNKKQNLEIVSYCASAVMSVYPGLDENDAPHIHSAWRMIEAAIPLEMRYVPMYLELSQDIRSFLKSPTQIFVMAKKAMRTALESSASPLNPSLKRTVGKSPDQDAILPLMLLTDAAGASIWGFNTPKLIISTFAASPLAFRIALDHLPAETCTLLAQSYLERPNPRLLEDLFTDALAGGKATPEKVLIFHRIGARPGPRSWECLLQSYNASETPDWNPHSIALIKLLLDLKVPLTIKALEKILMEMRHSVIDITLLETLLDRFKDENRELPSALLDAVICNKFNRDRLGRVETSLEDRIDLFLRLGCKPSTDTLIAFRESFRRTPQEFINDIDVRLFNHSHETKRDFVLRCLNDPKLFQLLSIADLREIDEIRPTEKIVQAFYETLGYFNERNAGVCVSIQRWLQMNRYSPNQESLFTSLKMGLLHYSDFKLDQVLEFHSVGIDCTIPANRPITLLLYCIQMQEAKPEEIANLKNTIKGREWLRKFGFELDFKTLEDVKTILQEVMTLFPPLVILPFIFQITANKLPITFDFMDKVPGLLLHPAFQHRQFTVWAERVRSSAAPLPAPAAPAAVAAAPLP